MWRLDLYARTSNGLLSRDSAARSLQRFVRTRIAGAMQATTRVKEVSLWLLVLAGATTGCIAEGAEPSFDELGETQQTVNVLTGSGQRVSCSGNVVLDGTGKLASCTLQMSTNVSTGGGLSITFNAGTTLVLYTNGFPTSGTLVSNSSIRTGAGASITFNAGTFVTLYSTGVIDTGTLVSTTNIRTGTGAMYACNAGTIAGLYSSGNLRTCVMQTNTSIPTGSGTVTCTAGLRVTLGTAGLFQSCQ